VLAGSRCGSCRAARAAATAAASWNRSDHRPAPALRGKAAAVAMPSAEPSLRHGTARGDQLAFGAGPVRVVTYESGGPHGAGTELNPYAPDLRKHEAAETALSHTRGRSMIIRVRGESAPKANTCWLVNSRLGAGRERGSGSMDPMDHDRLRRVAGAHRRSRVQKSAQSGAVDCALHGSPRRGYGRLPVTFFEGGLQAAAAATTGRQEVTGLTDGPSGLRRCPVPAGFAGVPDCRWSVAAAVASGEHPGSRS
jgi:hypothetical protein